MQYFFLAFAFAVCSRGLAPESSPWSPQRPNQNQALQQPTQWTSHARNQFPFAPFPTNHYSHDAYGAQAKLDSSTPGIEVAGPPILAAQPNTVPSPFNFDGFNCFASDSISFSQSPVPSVSQPAHGSPPVIPGAHARVPVPSEQSAVEMNFPTDWPKDFDSIPAHAQTLHVLDRPSSSVTSVSPVPFDKA